LIYTRQNIVRGLAIYTAGDTIAAIIIGEFAWSRVIGMMVIGGTLYALEIPNYFRWIDRKVAKDKSVRSAVYRTLLAIAYFNPLWIARHLCLIKIISLQFGDIHWSILQVGLWSFLANIPVTFAANYFIQNKLLYQWRFAGSAVFSALMAVYYAVSEVIF
jgi:hypothetical protein